MIYDELSDPNELLGRPGQYFAKATWRDARIRPDQDDPNRMDVDLGGTVELFRTPAEFEARRQYLELLTTSGVPWFVSYQYARWPVILRVSKALPPSLAAEYDRVLGEILEQAVRAS